MKYPFCVKPKLDNYRIETQQGAFIIFGCDSTTGSKELTSEPPHFKLRPEDTPALIIDRSAKQKIRDELELCGVNKGV